MRRLVPFAALLIAGCLDNAGPEDHPAQQIRVTAAPEGEQFPTDTIEAPVTVQVTAERGDPSPGREVTWVASSGGSFIPLSGVTDADGYARAIWVLGPLAGTQTATVEVRATSLSVTIPVETAGWRVAKVSAGRGDLACAIDLAGDTWCWESGPPARVESAIRFQSITTGWTHACALSTDRRVYCWGSNDLGQLGDGTTARRLAPTPAVLPEIEFVAVAAGQRFTCAVSVEGTAYCWGGNHAGQLGRGIITPSEPIPAPVAGEITWRSVGPGDDATCGIDSMRRLYCWGDGDADAAAVAIPTPVPGLPSADAVAVSAWQKCAIELTTLYCWGLLSGLPSPTLHATNIRTITAGLKPFFGLGTDDLVYYWGAVPNSSYGSGDPSVQAEGGIRFREVGGNDLTPLGIELETSTLYHWTSWRFDSIRGPSGPAPIRPPSQ